MTVIELLIALAVVGFMMVVGYMAIRHVRKSALREQTIEVAALMRSAYNMSAQTGQHHRVIFDLTEQTMRIEVCEEEIKLRRTARDELPDPEEEAELRLEEEARARGIPMDLLEAGSPEEARKMAEALMGTQLGAAQCKVPTLPSGDADGRGNVRQIRTERGIRIRRVFAQHLEEPAVDGIATVNFFPLGYAEKAIVEVAAEDGAQFTLLVHGLTGRIEFRDEELRDPNDHMMRDATGDKAEER